MAMGVLSVQQDRKKAEACSGRVFLLYELFRHEDDSAAAETMRLARGIIFQLSGLLLAGCMQSGPAWDANFTARDRQELANPPYKQATIPFALQRQVVQYSRQEPPGSILVDTDARYVYYVLPEGKAIRYGAIVGEHGQAPSGVAIVGRKEEWPGWTPTEMRSGGWARFRTISKAVRTIQWAREHYTFTPVARTLCIVSTAQISQYCLEMPSHRAASG